MTWRRAVLGMILFGISFGYVEAAVVVYLRHIYEPIRLELHPGMNPGDLFPLITADELKSKGPSHQRLLITELGREIATLVMLASAALAVSARFRPWLAAFALAFGVWDLMFYAFLKLLIGWPPSIFTWDILFLVPIPWVGPVLSPCIVAATMVAAGILTLRNELAGRELPFGRVHIMGILVGGLMLLAAFMWDWRNTTAGHPPNAFNWPLFAAGELLGAAAFTHALLTRRVPSPLESSLPPRHPLYRNEEPPGFRRPVENPQGRPAGPTPS